MLTGLYSIHAYETSKELLDSSKIEIFNNENFKKEREVFMEKDNIENLKSKTKNNSNPPVRHSFI